MLTTPIMARTVPNSLKEPMTDPSNDQPPSDPLAPAVAPTGSDVSSPAPDATAWAPPEPPSGGHEGVGFAVPATQVGGQPSSKPPVRSAGYGKWLVVVLIPVLAIVTFAGGVAADRTGFFGSETAAQATSSPATGNADLDLISQAWHTIHDNYVDSAHLDDRALAYGAIRGMTEAVGDEGHTSFLTADEAKAVDQSLSGSFVGIGVQVNDDDDKGPVISSVIPNTPAEQSNLQRGDHILAVDGWSTKDQAIDEVVSRVRGPEGQPVTLTIARDGRDSFDVTITRRKFDLPLVSWGMVPGSDVAMVRLEQFATGATKGVQDAIGEAKKAGAKGIILDLRGNPGGYVSEAIGVASQFVGEGDVYQSIDKSGKTEKVAVVPGGVYTDGPLVVLTNGDTASSAEIVTGAIQDAKRATVLGEKTFGTGTVLGRFDLADGSSMRIGVERWLTRAGRPIWHEGLEPDVKVALANTITPLVPDDLKGMSAAELAKSPDVQVLRALQVLQGR